MCACLCVCVCLHMCVHVYRYMPCSRCRRGCTCFPRTHIHTYIHTYIQERVIPASKAQAKVLVASTEHSNVVDALTYIHTYVHTSIRTYVHTYKRGSYLSAKRKPRSLSPALRTPKSLMLLIKREGGMTDRIGSSTVSMDLFFIV